MSRFYSYRQLVGVAPAPAPLVLGLSTALNQLPAFGSGLAVIAGSTAWGAPSWRSDIDVVAFRSDGSLDLEAGIAATAEAFDSTHGTTFLRPQIDVVWVGAEREEMVERDNLVSKSAAIKEPRTVSQVFERVCVRLIDHLESLAKVQGDPWRGFVARYLSQADHGSDLRRDVMGEYAKAITTDWRTQTFLLESQNESVELKPAELETLGNLEGFGYHFARQFLGEKQLYPAPDRRGDIRDALTSQKDPLVRDLALALNPLFALGDGYEQLAIQVQSGQAVDERSFYRELRSLASAIDIDAVERFVWSHLARDTRPGEPE